MSQYIYDNDPDESEQMGEIALNAAGDSEERMVSIYECTDGGHNSSLNTGRAVEQSPLDQQPGE